MRALYLFLLAAVLPSVACVSHQYSARSYRNVDTSVVYTIICHKGKKTIRVPEDTWEEHKAHFDYRGPCRPRGIPTQTPKPKPTHTIAEYKNRKSREKWSEEEYARHLEAQLLLKGETQAVEADGKAPD